MGGYYPEILRISPTRSAGAMETIGLSTPLRLGTAFRFPLQHQLARRELLWGAFLLLVLPGVGWLLNMGHRIQMVHNMQHERACWPAWVGYRHLLKLGTVTFLGMVEYHLPATFIGLLAWRLGIGWLWPIAAALGIAATVAVPGYMSHYCVEFDASEVFNPFKALRRVSQGGGGYWHAWAIALAALTASFAGLLALGVGFLVTSVWFWQVAGFSFATVFTQRFRLRSAT
jgi:hypothetical protein